MITTFFICWMPYAVVSLLMAYGYGHLITPTVAIIPSFFAKSSTAYNPVIYIFMNRKVSIPKGAQQHMLQSSYLIQSAISANVFLFRGREAGRRGQHSVLQWLGGEESRFLSVVIFSDIQILVFGLCRKRSGRRAEAQSRISCFLLSV